MELLLYKLGEKHPERRDVLSVGGALEVITIRRDGARMYQCARSQNRSTSASVSPTWGRAFAAES
jgi:hypothetical protein